MTVLTAGVVSTSGDEAVTVICSLTAACVSVTLSSRSCATMSSTLRVVTDENPERSALTAYGPTGSDGKRYDPSLAVTTERLKPVALFVAVTVTPGNAAPEASLTRPPRAALPVCASTAAGISSSMRMRRSGLFTMDLLLNLKLCGTIVEISGPAPTVRAVYARQCVENRRPARAAILESDSAARWTRFDHRRRPEKQSLDSALPHKTWAPRATQHRNPEAPHSCLPAARR